MSSISVGWNKGLKLNEIIDELENQDQDDLLPESIIIFPPENANAGNVTDEDSGDEDNIVLNNLPGSQLRAPAEAFFENVSSSECDSDDDLPLSFLMKRTRCNQESTVATQHDIQASTSAEVLQFSTVTSVSTVLQTPTDPSVSREQKYVWRSSRATVSQLTWQDIQEPKFRQDPLYFFNCMFSECIIELLVHYSNLYANQKNRISNITADEMKCFLGILLYSGYVALPRRFMYWETYSDTPFDLVANAMSRDRFTLIMTNLHCCDNNVLNQNDKFSKMRPLFDLLNKFFIDMCPFEPNYSVDEAMIPYYGRHSCKQFIRGKPIRWGYKFWVGATRLGYVAWFDAYQGHSSTIANAYKQFGLGGSVILQFADAIQARYPSVQFHLFFDNYFTSVPLLHELKMRGLLATGTVRENRISQCPLPPNKEFKKTDRGTHVSKSSRPADILVCKWNDNNVVTVASNIERVAPLHKVKRFSQQLKKHITVDQPALIKKYSENMGGVDRADQNIGHYRTSIRGKKWYFSLFTHCLDMAVHNAFQMYKHNGGQCDHLMFRRTVARGLLETFRRQERRGPSHTPAGHRGSSRFDKRDHIILYQDIQRRCTLCSIKTNFICKKCTVYLHAKHCFVN